MVLKLLIDAVSNNKIDGGKNIGNKTNLSNSFASKKFIRADYLIFKCIKKSGGNSNNSGNNTKKGVKIARGSDYLTLGNKKAFNCLWHTFTQTFIL